MGWFKKKSVKKEEEHWSSGIFLGCLFIGIALGFLFDEIVAGTLIGLGVGFVIAALLKRKR